MQLPFNTRMRLCRIKGAIQVIVFAVTDSDLQQSSLTSVVEDAEDGKHPKESSVGREHPHDSI